MKNKFIVNFLNFLFLVHGFCIANENQQTEYNIKLRSQTGDIISYPKTYENYQNFKETYLKNEYVKKHITKLLTERLDLLCDFENIYDKDQKNDSIKHLYYKNLLDRNETILIKNNTQNILNSINCNENYNYDNLPKHIIDVASVLKDHFLDSDKEKNILNDLINTFKLSQKNVNSEDKRTYLDNTNFIENNTISLSNNSDIFNMANEVKKQNKKIFISYAWSDKHDVNPIINDLKKLFNQFSIEIFYSNSQEDKDLKKFIGKFDAMVMCLNESYLKSSHMYEFFQVWNSSSRRLSSKSFVIIHPEYNISSSKFIDYSKYWIDKLNELKKNEDNISLNRKSWKNEKTWWTENIILDIPYMLDNLSKYTKFDYSYLHSKSFKKILKISLKNKPDVFHHLSLKSSILNTDPMGSEEDIKNDLWGKSLQVVIDYSERYEKVDLRERRKIDEYIKMFSMQVLLCSHKEGAYSEIEKLEEALAMHLLAMRLECVFRQK